MALFTGTTVSVISDNKLAKNAIDSMTAMKKQTIHEEFKNASF